MLIQPKEAVQKTPYEIVGGDVGTRALVDRFYDLMELDERFVGIRSLHPPSLNGSRDKLYWFLSGWFGGPQMYVEQFGHPRLRARHMPFAIGESERDQWMTCMIQALQDRELPEPFIQMITQSFFKTADWMRNKEG
jgi:hemoglobin